MNREETGRILSTVAEVYPAFRKDRDPAITTTVWQRVFRNTPYRQVSAALCAYIATDTRGFPPVPGALNALIAQQQELEGPTEGEAWSLVAKALSRGIYNAREEYEKLPEDIQRIVGSPAQIHDWAMMDARDVQTVIASTFKRAWRARQEAKRMSEMYALLPESETPRLEDAGEEK